MPESPEQLNVKKPPEDMEKKPDDLEVEHENEPEKLEDLEKLSQEKIGSVEKESEELGGSEKRMDDCNHSVNLPADKLEEIKATSGVVEKLEAINEKSKSLKEAFKEKMRILLAGAMIATGSIDANVAKASADSKIKSESKIEEVVENKDKEKENAEAYYNKIAELKESVYGDNHEKIVIVSKNNGNLEFVEDVGEKNFGYIDFKKIENSLKNGSGKIEIIHTHPLEGYPNYSQQEIDEIKKGESEPSPHPPSATDIMSLIQELNYFKADNKRVENKVIDPAGEWTFKIDDENNYFIKRYLAFSEKYNNPEIYETTLNETEKNDFQKKGGLIDITHPEHRIMYFPDKIKKMMLDDIRKDFPDKKWFDLFGEDKSMYNKNFAETKDLGLKTSKYEPNRTEKDEKELIKNYIEKCKKIGINVSYKPFRDKEK